MTNCKTYRLPVGALLLMLLFPCGWNCRTKPKRASLPLPDGSEVTIKKGTDVRVPPMYGDSTREVQFDGEAMFEVRSFHSAPFIVLTKYLRIEVPGDVAGQVRFHVDAWSAKPGEQVDLLAGRLKVTKSYHSNSDNEPEIVQAGEMVMINRDIDLMEKEKMDGTELKNWNAGD